VLTDTARSLLQASSPTFSFTIGTAAFGGATITIDIPYAAFDLQAGYPVFGAPTNYFPLRRAANNTQFTLGRAFLQEVYLSVDWERDVFNISQAVFSSPPLAPDIVTIEPKNRTNTLVPRPGPIKPTKLSAGAIAGIAIGAVLLISILAGLGWWLYRRKQKAKDVNAEPTLPVNDEKKSPHELASDGVEKPPMEPRTNLELEGRTVEELCAPLGHHEMHSPDKQPENVTELVEADSQSPIYELPSPDQHVLKGHI
jgi:hypothetical protein